VPSPSSYFLISDRSREGRADGRFILVAEQNAAFAEPSRWSTTSPSVQSAGMEVDDIFGYDWGARAPRVLVLAPKRTSDDLIFDSGFSR
jgi:hypothetical protein